MADVDNDMIPDMVPAEPSAGTASEATSAPASEGTESSAAATSTDAGSAQPTQAVDGQAPSKPNTDQTQQPQTVQDWQHWKKLHDSQAAANRRLGQQHQEYLRKLQEYEQRYSGVDPSAIAQWKEAQARAQREGLPAWDPRNPNAHRFQALLDGYGRLHQQYQSAQSPEDRDRIRNLIAQSYSQEEQQQIAGWFNHQKEFQARLAQGDPRLLAEMVDQRVNQILHQQQQWHRETQTVEAWFNDKKNQELATNYGQEMLSQIQAGQPWDVVRERFELRAQLDELRSKVGAAETRSKSAEAKEQLLKGKATVSRDPVVSKPVDIMTEARRIARERGYRPGDPRIMTITRELEAKASEG